MPAFIEVHLPKPLQSEFVALVNDARDRLRTELGSLLDSLYLYGSVSRANAQPGESDLDLTLVLSRPLAMQEKDSLERIRVDLERRHPEVTKVDFDVGVREDVLNPTNLHSWGYWLKHECRCIYGTDLALQFRAFQPSQAVAQAVNGDYVQVLCDYVTRISNANSRDEMQRLQKEAARKLVRATNVLRPSSDSYWPRTLEEYAEYFSKHHPEMAEQVHFFLVHTKTPCASDDVFNEKLVFFTDWMQQSQRSSMSATGRLLPRDGVCG